MDDTLLPLVGKSADGVDDRGLGYSEVCGNAIKQPMAPMTLRPTHFKGIIRPISDCSSKVLAEQWQLLESLCEVPFSLSWCWIQAWLALVKDRTQLFVFECWGGSELVAMGFLSLCPVKRLKGHLTFVQLQLNEYASDGLDMSISYNGLLGKSEYMGAAWECFFQTALSWSERWDEISLRALVHDQYNVAVQRLAGLNLYTDRIYKIWRVSFREQFSSLEELISTFKRKSRQQLRQTHSAYLEVGDLTIKAAEDREEALGLFHKMERLHTMRWKKFGKNGSYANPRWVEFHTNIIESCFQSGNVQLLEIKCGGEALGYLYGHVYDNNVYMHQTGFVQTESAKFRPGYLSHCLAMWLNVREGNMVYDFLPDAADSYKKFFASEGPDVYFVRAARPRLKFVYEASLRKVAGSLKTLTSSYRGTGGKDS